MTVRKKIHGASVGRAKEPHSIKVHPSAKERRKLTVDFSETTRVCKRKRVFETEGEAATSGRAMALRPYRCPRCHKWHLTSIGTDSQDHREEDEDFAALHNYGWPKD
jgi:hypothetical protein